MLLLYKQACCSWMLGGLILACAFLYRQAKCCTSLRTGPGSRRQRQQQRQNHMLNAGGEVGYALLLQGGGVTACNSTMQRCLYTSCPGPVLPALQTRMELCEMVPSCQEECLAVLAQEQSVVRRKLLPLPTCLVVSLQTAFHSQAD